jgi:uncharacterized protein YbjT (DUF2867 family)
MKIESHPMKVAVIGGTGLIGSRVVDILNRAGHDAVPLSRSTGVDVFTGEGLDAALAGAKVVVNLTDARPLTRPPSRSSAVGVRNSSRLMRPGDIRG